MPTSITPPPKDDETECGNCGAYIYHGLMKCPNCGVYLVDPVDTVEGEHPAVRSPTTVEALVELRSGGFLQPADAEALEGFALLARLEGIIPALESAHAVAWLASAKGRWKKKDAVVVCVSGRGDKDVAQVMDMNLPGL